MPNTIVVISAHPLIRYQHSWCFWAFALLCILHYNTYNNKLAWNVMVNYWQWNIVNFLHNASSFKWPFCILAIFFYRLSVDWWVVAFTELMSLVNEKTNDQIYLPVCINHKSILYPKISNYSWWLWLYRFLHYYSIGLDTVGRHSDHIVMGL